MPKDIVYGGNITITMKGTFPVNIQKGVGFSMIIWYEDIPGPIFKVGRRRHPDCSKYKYKQSTNSVTLISKNYSGAEWESFICSLKQGAFVNRSVVLPFTMREQNGDGGWDKLPGALFPNGWYRAQLKFVDYLDDEFLCVEAKLNVKMTTK